MDLLWFEANDEWNRREKELIKAIKYLTTQKTKKPIFNKKPIYDHDKKCYDGSHDDDKNDGK